MPMKKYKPEQIVTLLRQVEVELANGKTTPQACRKAQIAAQTYDRWRKEFGSREYLAVFCGWVLHLSIRKAIDRMRSPHAERSCELR